MGQREELHDHRCCRSPGAQMTDGPVSVVSCLRLMQLANSVCDGLRPVAGHTLAFRNTSMRWFEMLGPDVLEGEGTIRVLATLMF